MPSLFSKIPANEFTLEAVFCEPQKFRLAGGLSPLNRWRWVPGDSKNQSAYFPRNSDPIYNSRTLPAFYSGTKSRQNRELVHAIND